MSELRKILLVFAGDGAAAPADGLDPRRLAEVLRKRGGQVEELSLAGDQGVLLDHLQGGALPVVFDGNRGLSR
jgi:hypothetical protein